MGQEQLDSQKEVETVNEQPEHDELPPSQPPSPVSNSQYRLLDHLEIQAQERADALTSDD